jgi:hypothetical protein
MPQYKDQLINVSYEINTCFFKTYKKDTHALCGQNEDLLVLRRTTGLQ